jgi:hypothetical protein
MGCLASTAGGHSAKTGLETNGADGVAKASAAPFAPQRAARIGRKVACAKPAGAGGVHDIAKKPMQLPIVHCKPSE